MHLTKKIVLLDDNLVIRDVVRSLLESIENRFAANFQIYSSDNGIEGLGYVFTLMPELIIIDTTLPKYSGREIVQYLINNTNLNPQGLCIILSHEDSLQDKLSSNFVTLDKNDDKFLDKLVNRITNHFEFKQESAYNFWDKLKLKLARKAIKAANSRDRLFYNHDNKPKSLAKPFFFIFWIASEVLLSIRYTLFRLLSGIPPEEAIEQKEKDNLAYRIRYYPTLLTMLVGVLITFAQLVAFVGGGIVVMGVRIDPAFAFRDEEAVYELNSANADRYTYDANLLEISDSGAKLKSESLEQDPGDGSQDGGTDAPANDPGDTPPAPDGNQDNSTQNGNQDSAEPGKKDDKEKPKDATPESYPQAPSVQGITTTESFPMVKPSLTTKDPVIYSKLQKISVESETPGSTALAYQLSPDGNNWYYWSETENVWTKTTQGWESSSSLQTVNQRLNEFEELLNTGELSLKVFFSSTGDATPVLRKITVERETSFSNGVVDNLNGTKKKDEEKLTSIDFENLEVVLFDASFFNGNKVVKGKLLAKEKSTVFVYDINTENLAEYEAEVYYSSTSSRNNAAKGKLIGRTDLYFNARGEVEFTLKTPDKAGGYVTAQIVEKAKNGKAGSNLSSPLENSTFTVDSTGDGADAVLDGLCADGGGACTLRAALQEANNVAGSDNIFFNISIADSGYRDYDLPNTASSGDGSGGDDYWTIRPATSLPTVADTTIIDGSSQALNQFNSNTDGPEIEVKKSGAGGYNGFSFSIAAGGSSLNDLIINAFSAQIVISGGTTYAVTDSYIGTDAKGAAFVAGSAEGIQIAGGTDIHIGNTTSDGNIIGGSGNSILVNCTIDGAANSVFIQGNSIGIGANSTSDIGGSIGINVTQECQTVVGGDTSNQRNVIGNHLTGISASSFAASTLATLEVYNNFLGVASNGTTINRNTNTDINISGTPYDNPTDQYIIGAPTKGNFFPANNTHITVVAARDVRIERNTFGNCGFSCISDTGNANGLSFNKVKIYSNYFNASTLSDPLFSLPIVHTSYPIGGILTTSASPDIKGNFFDGTMYIDAIRIRRNAALNFADSIQSPTIGGQNALANSLCGGLEKNCFNTVGSIFPQLVGAGAINGEDTLPYDEANLHANNDFMTGNGQGGASNVYVMWEASFEIFSGSVRRTDLNGQGITLPISTPNEVVTPGNGQFITAIPIKAVACTVPANCPAAGATSGTVGLTAVAMSGGSFTNTNLQAKEYETLLNGSKYNTGTYKFDLPHFASQTFSFDADSSTHPVVGDRGEEWTTYPAATRDYGTQSIGINQVMEVEYVDANPVLQGDGSYIITVDSASNEDNVSTTGFDDGGGAYSGGGVNGPDGIANGKTSFREAIIVANNHPGHDIIHFNIPNSDAGYINADGSRTSTAEPAGTYPTTAGGYFTIRTTQDTFITDPAGVTIDGYSQAGAAKNTAAFGSTLNTVLKIQIKREMTPLANAVFNSTGSSNNIITGLNIQRAAPLAPPGDGPEVVSVIGGGNNWVKGNYIGSNINGDGEIGVAGKLNIGSMSTNNIVGTNGDGNDDVAEKNLITGMADHATVHIHLGVGGNNFNNIVAGNYIRTDKTGNACVNIDSGNDRAAVFFETTSDGSRLGSNLDGISDTEESNILGGCISSAYRTTARMWSSNTFVANNWINVSPTSATILNPVVTGVPGIDIAGTGSVYRNNHIKSFTTNSNAVNITSSSNLLQNNEIVSAQTHGISIVANVTGVTLDANTISNTGGAGIQTGFGISKYTKNIFNNITGLNIDINPLGVNINDIGDADSGINNLQNYPIIRSVNYLGGNQFEINGGMLANNAEGPFQIEICEGGNHSSGHRGCVEHIETFTMNTAGTWTRTVTLPGAVGTERFAVLATNNNNATSEFGTYIDADPVFDSGTNEWVITVNATSDEDNVSLLGYDDGGGVYSGGGSNGSGGLANGKTTLREAIIVANNHPGKERIVFDIPTSDPGYKDFNPANPLLPGVGDAAGGDDYWEIRPAVVLPQITDTTIIDGASQEVNSGNDNNIGVPDIELVGTTAGEVDGLVFAATADDSALNSLTVNRFGTGASRAGLLVLADDFTVTNSLLGLNASGLNGFAERQFHGVRVQEANNVFIGTDTANGNVISNNVNYGVALACGVTGTGKTVKVRGNIIGLDKDGNIARGNGIGVLAQGECLAEIGGEVQHRNIIGGQSGNHAINTLLAQNEIPKVEIYNNFIGTDITGTQDRRNRRQIGVEWGGTDYEADYTQVIIGAEGKGNLIRFGVNGNIRLAHGRRNVEVAYNTVSNSFESGIEISEGTQNDTQGSVYVHHNYWGSSTSDPHFGINVGPNAWGGILLSGRHKNVEIADNEIHNSDSGFWGIALGGPNDNIHVHGNNIRNSGLGIVVSGPNSPLIEENEITANANYGISIQTLGAGSTVRNNKLYGNATLDLNLVGGTEDANSVTANDDGDEDTGPNDLQNQPVIEKIEYYKATGKYRVYGDLDEKDDEGPWIIEVCEADSHASGHGGCIQHLGYTTANSPWVVDVEIAGSDGTDGRIFTVLATNSNGSTSEFGLNFDAVETNPDYDIIEPPVIPPVIPPPTVIPPANPPAIGDDNDDEQSDPDDEDEPGAEDPDDEDPDSETPPTDGGTPVPTAGGLSDDGDNTASFEVPGSLGPIVPFAMALVVVLIASLVLGPLVDLFSRVGPIIGIVIPRKRKYWGIVFDVIEGEEIPFASVVLKKAFTKELVAREITDLQGRYALSAPAGEYLLEVSVSGYKLFTRSVTVKENEEVIQDVPMVQRERQLLGSFKQFIYYNRQWIIGAARVTYLVLMGVGFIYTCYALYVSPIWINYIFFALYLLVIIIALVPILRGKVRGRVVDSDSNLGLHAAVVRLYNGKVVEDIALSRQNGEVKLHSSAGQKEVYIQRLNYEDNRQKVFVTAGKLDRNVQMKPRNANMVNGAAPEKFSL